MVNKGNTSCVVSTCPNVGRKTASRGVSYHRFPKKDEIKKLWVRKCGRSDQFNTGASYICSDHFEDDDYERDLRAELLNLPPKKKLKSETVPSRNLPAASCQSRSEERKHRLSQCNSKNKVCIVITELKPSNSSNITEKFETAESDEDKKVKRNEDAATEGFGQDEMKMKVTIEKVEEETNSFCESPGSKCGVVQNKLKQQLRVQRLREIRHLTKIASLRRKLYLKNDELKKLKYVIKTLSTKKSGKKMICDEVTTILRTCFSHGQIKHLIDGCGHWTAEDISSATVMRSLSKELYEFLRSENYPFPSEATIRRWNQLNLKVCPTISD
ncbi:hypothetical protein CHUAL_005747 [Chamberlinius hualienensis]